MIAFMKLGNETNEFLEAKRVHFIGIGGIGMSAVARMLLEQGKIVTGSDGTQSPITDELVSLGAEICIGHKAQNIGKDVEAVVYTVAIPKDNPELKEAVRRNGLLLTYAESLREISKSKYTVAISGTHGKTTTTSMIAEIMMDAKLDPTVIVGSLMKRTQSNFVFGHSKYFVVEACEYKRSFLNLEPSILVITNIDADHLDYYKDMKDIQRAFTEMILRVSPGGYIVCNPRDENVKPVLASARAKVIDYTQFQDERLQLKIPGMHNRENAAAALAVAHVLEVSTRGAKKTLSGFEGTWRRFDLKGKTVKGALVYDDYGHHPTEIRATLSGAREMYPEQKIIAVFQPHLYSRTKEHLEEFGACFADANEVVLAPIYAARESNDSSVTSAMVAEKISLHGQEAKSFDNFSIIKEYILSHAEKDDVIVMIGAGDIYTLSSELLAQKEKGKKVEKGEKKKEEISEAVGTENDEKSAKKAEPCEENISN
jgi:UDP-N-acetylmuramate--alanine ligase